MGLEATWNQPAFFAFVDRWIAEGASPEGEFATEMWAAWSGAGSQAKSCP